MLQFSYLEYADNANFPTYICIFDLSCMTQVTRNCFKNMNAYSYENTRKFLIIHKTII